MKKLKYALLITALFTIPLMTQTVENPPMECSRTGAHPCSCKGMLGTNNPEESSCMNFCKRSACCCPQKKEDKK